MNIYDLNPGDIIRIKPAEYRVNIFRRDITEEEFEITHLKLNDSFPEARIQVPMIEKQKDVNGKEFIISERYIDYGVNAKEIQLVEHLNRNTKRWNWIVDRIAIGDNYPTLYYSIIAGNEFARFNWQTWGDDFIEVTFFYTYYSKKTSSFHTVEINPDGPLRNWFEDFDNDIDRDDYSEGVETTDTWYEPTEDDKFANWMAHLVWLGPSYDWPDWPEMHTDDVEVVKSACSRLYARIEEYKKEHEQ